MACRRQVPHVWSAIRAIGATTYGCLRSSASGLSCTAISIRPTRKHAKAGRRRTRFERRGNPRNITAVAARRLSGVGRLRRTHLLSRLGDRDPGRRDHQLRQLVRPQGEQAALAGGVRTLRHPGQLGVARWMPQLSVRVDGKRGAWLVTRGLLTSGATDLEYAALETADWPCSPDRLRRGGEHRRGQLMDRDQPRHRSGRSAATSGWARTAKTGPRSSSGPGGAPSWPSCLESRRASSAHPGRGRRVLFRSRGRRWGRDRRWSRKVVPPHEPARALACAGAAGRLAEAPRRSGCAQQGRPQHLSADQQGGDQRVRTAAAGSAVAPGHRVRHPYERPARDLPGRLDQTARFRPTRADR